MLHLKFPGRYNSQVSENVLRRKYQGKCVVFFVSHTRGGGGESPQILVGMCRGKVQNGQGFKMRVSGTSLSRFELENEGLRNELEPL